MSSVSAAVGYAAILLLAALLLAPAGVLALDTDGDGIDDASDNCVVVLNSDQADLDNDGVGDACDFDIDGDATNNTADCAPMDSSKAVIDCSSVCGGTASMFACDECRGGTTGLPEIDPDLDSDGVLDCNDTCPAIANPDQTDTDSDGAGDECDNDDDDDETIDTEDCAPLDSTRQVPDCNSECGGSAVQDVCSNCVGGSTGLAVNPDSDSDGVTDCMDNCVAIANSGQADVDGDAIGDACDDDNDNDNVPNAQDCDPLDSMKKTNDCAGTCAGQASIDACSRCSGGTTGVDPFSECPGTGRSVEEEQDGGKSGGSSKSDGASKGLMYGLSVGAGVVLIVGIILFVVTAKKHRGSGAPDKDTSGEFASIPDDNEVAAM